MVCMFNAVSMHVMLCMLFEHISIMRLGNAIQDCHKGKGGTDTECKVYGYLFII